MQHIELGLLNINSIDQPDLVSGEIDVIGFLEQVEEIYPFLNINIAKWKLQAILNRINYKHCRAKNLPNPRIMTKRGIPMNVGGYFQPGTDYIVINPITLLYGSEADCFRILQHETNHYAGIEDESTTDLLAVLQMEEEGYRTEGKTGYAELVDSLRENLGEITSDQLLELIEEDDLATLGNFIEAIFIDKIIAEKGCVGFAEIRELITGKWALMQKLFPRLLNSLFSPMKGVHDHADNTHMDEAAWKNIERRYFTRCIEAELLGDGHTLAHES